jgi:predicted negative regulator of RcsB-dependent stress response
MCNSSSNSNIDLLQGTVATCSSDAPTAAKDLFSDTDRKKLEVCFAGLNAVVAHGGDKQVEELLKQRIADLRKSHRRSLNPGHIF